MLALASLVALAQPSPRLDPAMAYDSGSGLVVVYGGEDANGRALGDTWVFDPASSAWTQRAPASSPPPLREHLLVYDQESDRIVVWGGFTPDGENLELWTYDTDGDAWAQIEPTTAVPPGRRDSAAVYAPSIDRMVVVGGWDQMTGPNLSDTWLLDVDRGAWTEVVTEPSISNRVMHVLAYDASTDAVYLLGGLSDEGADGAQGAFDVDRVWVFDPRRESWTERSQIEGPANLERAAWAPLAGSGSLLFYGGGPFGDDQTWIYDVEDHAWATIDAPQPGPLSRHGMVALPDGSVLLFGGQYGWRSDDVRADVWRFDPATSTWTQMTP